jgi:hypothetical protein
MPSGGLEEYWETPQTLNTTWGYSKFVTVQVPLSIFLDKSRRIGYRMVDGCESGSP